MPIENPEPVNQTSIMVSEQNLFNTVNIIIAGKIMVKHPLMAEILLLIGFVIEDGFLNNDDFRVKGMEINYKLVGESNYFACNPIIYPKIIIDKKSNHCSTYFKNNNLILRKKHEQKNAYFKEGAYYNDNIYSSKWGLATVFNYYMFDEITATIPEAAADQVYALCKCKENGMFKHYIFNFHELELHTENKK